VALTCGIELAQGAWLPTRVSDPRDVVANSAGAAIGIALLLAGRRLLAQGGSRS
jgi:VanZ family protein